MLWLAGGALAVALTMIVGLLVLVLYQGLRTFWPQPVERSRNRRRHDLPRRNRRPQTIAGASRAACCTSNSPRRPSGPQRQAAASGGALEQEKIRVENFELTNEHYVWVDEFLIREATLPEWALVVERLTNGRFYGLPNCLPCRWPGSGQHSGRGVGQIPSSFIPTCAPLAAARELGTGRSGPARPARVGRTHRA